MSNKNHYLTLERAGIKKDPGEGFKPTNLTPAFTTTGEPSPCLARV